MTPVQARRIGSCLAALAVVLVLSSHWAAAQSSGAPSAVGADRIRAMLTQHQEWTQYWSGLGAAPRPPASAGVSTVQFTRSGDTIMAHISIPTMSRECDVEIQVRENGFGWPGCLGPQQNLVRPADRDIVYDPDDPDYPFKGTGANTWYWFQPKK